MPVWLTIVIAVVGLIGTILGILGFTAYHNERMKQKAILDTKKEEQEREEIDQLKRKKYKEELREVIREETEGLKADVSSIRKDLAMNTKGTVTILRNDMKKSLDYCKAQGFASTSDKANWNELYNTYSELGGNHFKEYVNGWKKEMEELPSAKKTSRKKLVEKK